MATSLSKCYTPLPFSSFPVGDKSKTNITQQQQQKHHSCRKRPPNELRPIYMDTRILSSADGSSVVEMGHTKVVCAVHGPRSFSASSAYDSEIFHEEGVLNVDVRFALPFAVRPETVAMNQDTSVDGTFSGATQQQQSPEEMELSSRVYDAIFSSLVQSTLKRLYKSVLDVHLMVLQADGGLTSACIIAVSLALADAGVELYDMVPSCCVAIYNNCKENNSTTLNNPITCVADPTEDEINDADGVITLAVLYNCSDVTFWNQTGRISVEASSQAMELCKDGCQTIYQCMKQCLLSSKEQT